jgi:hypothetical protein
MPFHLLLVKLDTLHDFKNFQATRSSSELGLCIKVQPDRTQARWMCTHMGRGLSGWHIRQHGLDVWLACKLINAEENNKRPVLLFSPSEWNQLQAAQHYSAAMTPSVLALGAGKKWQILFQFKHLLFILQWIIVTRNWKVMSKAPESNLRYYRTNLNNGCLFSEYIYIYIYTLCKVQGFAC